MFKHDRAHKILLRKQQFRFAIPIDIDRAEPGLFDRAAGWHYVNLFKILARYLAKYFHLLVRSQNDNVRLAVLVDIMNGDTGGVRLEAVAQFLRFDVAIITANHERTLSVLINDDHQAGFAIGLQLAGCKGERLTGHWDQCREWQASFLVQVRHSDLPFAALAR